MISSNTPSYREYGVCAPHGKEIRDGAEWRPDGDQLSRDRHPVCILMGNDLTASGPRFSGYRLETDMLSAGSSGEPLNKLTMIADRGGEKEEFTFEITDAQMGRLSRDFAVFDKDSGRQ